MNAEIIALLILKQIVCFVNWHFQHYFSIVYRTEFKQEKECVLSG